MSVASGQTSREERTVSSLVDMIKHGELKLPEMQRSYVWTSTQVRDLLDSLYRGYPSGAILMWEADEQDATRELQIAQEKSAFKAQKLLLDGQQRLTSLSAVLRGEPIRVRNRIKPIDIAFNLDHPLKVAEMDEDYQEETEAEVDGTSKLSIALKTQINKRAFAVSSPAILSQANWVSVTRVMSGSLSEWELLKPVVQSPDHPKYTVYTDRLRALKAIANYTYVVQVLGKRLSYEEVTAIFVRVNSAGAKLRGSDLALAQITAKWPGSLALFEQFLKEVENTSKYQLDTGFIVRTLVAFATGQSRFLTVGSIPKEKLESAWKSAKDGIAGALNFMRHNAGFEDVSLLASKFYLIPIAVYFIRNKGVLIPQEISDMLRWLYTANIRGRYSVSTETKLDADLQILRRGGSFGEMADQFAQDGGRLLVSPSDLYERGQRSPLFAFSYLACKFHGAVDWETGAPLSLSHQGSSAWIEFHHIFPKSLLQKAGASKAHINEIANMAFLSGKANRKISNKPAASYLPIVASKQGKLSLERHGIPLEEECWSDYELFIQKRREELARMINSFVQQAIVTGHASRVEFSRKQ